MIHIQVINFAELITSSYRNSFLKIPNSACRCRAGNVIGGGDWATDRLIPDFFRSLESNKKLYVRSPDAIRPWQHVFDPLFGYIKLAEKYFKNKFDQAWIWSQTI